MTTVTITPENLDSGASAYHAVAGALQSEGRTPGEALDALTSQLDEREAGTLVVIQQMRPDHLFTAVQRSRLAELMKRWRAARDSQSSLPSSEQAELDRLVEAELHAATERAAAIARQFQL